MNRKLKNLISIAVIAVFLFAGVLYLKEQMHSSEQGGGTSAPSGQDIEQVVDAAEDAPDSAEIDKLGEYTTKDEVALYIHTYGELPNNFITKKEAEKLGWDSSAGNLDEVAPGKSIGGSRFGNYDKQLPEKKGRSWKECDINYHGGYRGAERILFSNDGLVFYTDNHYKTFEQLY
ncbi:MAG: ribonuclease domain-containing protein [Oscillospiraceae bacterium]